MDLGEAVIAAYMTLWSAAIGALVCGTYRRLEQRIDRLEERSDQNIASVRADITQIALAVGASRRASEG